MLSYYLLFILAPTIKLTLVYMYVCMVTTYSRVWVNRVRLPILLVLSLTEKIYFSLSPFAPENFGLARRVRPSRPASACSFSIYSGCLKRDQSPAPAIGASVVGSTHTHTSTIYKKLDTRITKSADMVITSAPLAFTAYGTGLTLCWAAERIAGREPLISDCCFSIHNCC